MEYFKNTLSSGSDSNSGSWEEFLEAMPRLVNEDENRMLLKPFMKEEVRITFFGLHSDKSPGLDGFPAIFFQKCWGFMNKDIWRLVEDARNKGKFIKEINNTVPVLILKIPDRITLDYYRPIALCNTLDKIISKEIANRLKKIMPKLISME
jgi:hypothetical protein